MELTPVPVNIFVFGDLVLDHYIPATVKRRPYQAVGGEQVFDGHPRRTIPGGGANSARLLTALGRGRVCLWGLTGHSPWGSFSQILEKSHRSERPDRGVIFHGSHNEAHQMNTVTRVVNFDKTGMRHRVLRVDDVHYAPTTDWQHRDAMAFLKAEADQHGIHAIILNDLDMNALIEELVIDICKFSNTRGIPIFVDPKRDWNKYRKVQVTCALPNLREWCHIIEDADGENFWRRSIQEGRLEPIAVKCLRYMPNVDFHLIKCDELGAVLIAPSGSGHRKICRVEPHPARTRTFPGQLGAGDILVAALTMEYVGFVGDGNQYEKMLKAIEKAFGVVACYLEMDWQEVPNEREIKAFELQRIRTSHDNEVPESVLLLPEGDVDLRKFSILGSKLVSNDPTYINRIKEIVAFLREGWGSSDSHSVILTGKGGVGKTEFTAILSQLLGEIGVCVWPGFDCSKAKCSDVDSAIALIARKLREFVAETKGLLVVIDEAFSNAGHLLAGENGKMLLQGAAKYEPCVRFLLIDADLEKHRADLSESQFLARCKEFVLPPLQSRHGDISYIFGASCLIHLGVSSIRISEAVLLGAINSILKTPEAKQTPRQIHTLARDVINLAKKDVDFFARRPPEVSKRHLPEDLRSGIEVAGGQKRFFQFSW